MDRRQKELIDEIQNVAEKLLTIATRPIGSSVDGGTPHEEKEQLELQKKAEERNTRAILKGKIATYELIEQAHKIVKNSVEYGTCLNCGEKND